MNDGFMDGVQNFLLSSDFLQKIMVFILDIIVILTNIILLPFSVLIRQFLPDLDTGLQSVSELFDLAGTYVGWALSLAGVPSILLVLTIAYYIFSITVTMSIWGTKLALKWVDTFR